MGVDFNPFGSRLSSIATKFADDYFGPNKEKIGREIETSLTITEIREFKKIFRDEHGGKKVFFAGLIALVITATGSLLTFAPPKYIPEACKENGPSILVAGVSLLGGFFLGKI